MAVTIHRLSPKRAWRYEVKCEHNGTQCFCMLSEAKRWATETFSLSGKWRKVSDEKGVRYLEIED